MSPAINRSEEAGLVRPMERHDLAVVSGLIARLARHHGDEPALEVAGLARDLFGAEPGLHGLVAERFSYVVGYALIIPSGHRPCSGRGLELHHLFVLEGSRGLGLGRKLVEGAADVARDRGYDVLMAGAHPGNRNAQAFYEALGFAPHAGGESGGALVLDRALLKMPV